LDRLFLSYDTEQGEILSYLSIDSADSITIGGKVKSKCGACKELTTHTIVSMTDDAPAQVLCSICKRTHLYRPAAKPKAVKPKKVNPETEEWLRLSPKWEEAKAVQYKMNKVFKKGALLAHGKFGLGQVQQTLGAGKMRVLFESGVKLMRCGE